MKYFAHVYDDSDTKVNSTAVEADSFDAAVILAAEYTEELIDELNLLSAHWRIKICENINHTVRRTAIVSRRIRVEHKIESWADSKP